MKKRGNKSETVWCYEDRNVKGSLERTFSKRRYEGKESNNQTLISALRSDTRLDPTEISSYVSFHNQDLYDANINMFVIPYVRVFFLFLLFYFTTYIHYVSNRDGMFMQTPFRNNPRGISHLPTSNLTSWRISPLKKPNPTLSTTTRRAQSVT